tara:strand:- start:328 stop:768 length:441 start_codon:yes stop_codon:yes gene_type:complete
MAETDRIAQKRLLREALKTIVVDRCDFCGCGAETPTHISGFSNKALNAWFMLPQNATIYDIGKLYTCEGKNCYVTICDSCKLDNTEFDSDGKMWRMAEKQVGRGSPVYGLSEADYTMVQGCRDCFDEIWENTTTHHYDRVRQKVKQ